jgi:hypothetical protein
MILFIHSIYFNSFELFNAIINDKYVNKNEFNIYSIKV